MTYLDIKTKALVRIVYTNPNGKIQCRCITSGMFSWRDSMDELMLVEHWMIAY